MGDYVRCLECGKITAPSCKLSFSWTPKLIGKHLLAIDVYDEEDNILHLENIVFVGGNVVDNTASATLVWGGI